MGFLLWIWLLAAPLVWLYLDDRQNGANRRTISRDQPATPQ
jgi:hypothetical protein